MNKIISNPLELEIEPGKTVGDLTSADECQQAMFLIDLDLERIQAQIARAEADPTSVEPGWRSRAQAAIRWKKRTRAAVYEFGRRFQPPKAPAQQRLAALCDVISQELGRERLDELFQKAKRQHPEAFDEAGANEGTAQ